MKGKLSKMRTFRISSSSQLLVFSLYVSSFVMSTVPAKKEDVGNSTMKALVLTSFGDPTVLKVQTVKKPTIAEHEILVKVKAAGICPLDAYIRAGTYAKKPELPSILGREISGIVEDVHSTVRAFKVGERVFCGFEYGGYAEYVAASEYDCYPLPARLTFEEGAAIYTTYFTTFRGLVPRGHVKRGDTILIHDASGVLGRAAVEVGKHIGAIVVACVTEDGLESDLIKAGADHIVRKSDKNYLRWILTKINRRGFDLIFELLGNFDLDYDKLNLSEFGRIVVVGNRISVMQCGRNVFAVSFSKYTRAEQDDAAGCILGGIENGTINPVVSNQFKLEEGPYAHHKLRRSTKEKLIFTL